MTYYDIHTHQNVKTPNVRSIVNLFPGDTIPAHSYCSVGIHPNYIHTSHIQHELALVSKTLAMSEVVALGEIGLDKNSHVSIDVQRKVFIDQWEINRVYNKPIIIHCVKAFDELLSLKKRLNDTSNWIIHGFRGKPQQATQLISHGFALSFGYWFNEEAVKVAFPDSLFLETDDRSISISDVYQSIASSLDLNLDQVANAVKVNADKLFAF